jgi:K+-sensing histidine kinase KdpD
LIGFLVLLGLATAFGAARGQVAPPVSLVLFAVALAGCALMASVPVALLLTACAVMDYDAFVVGQHGQLSWHGTADGVRIAVLVGVAAAAVLVRRTTDARKDAR